MLKGVIVVYVNFFPELDQTLEHTLNFVKTVNSELYDKVRENGYEFMFVGTTKEGTRIEKIDFDVPFPRSILPKMDIVDYSDIEKSFKSRLINRNVSLKIKDNEINEDNEDDEDEDE